MAGPPRPRALGVDHRLQLVLEGAGLDRAVDAALLGRVGLPPPAAGARVLARLRGPRAGGAADAGVPLGVEWMDGDVVGLVVLLDLVERPVGQRADLGEAAVIVIDLELADVGPAR